MRGLVVMLSMLSSSNMPKRLLLVHDLVVPGVRMYIARAAGVLVSARAMPFFDLCVRSQRRHTPPSALVLYSEFVLL